MSSVHEHDSPEIKEELLDIPAQDAKGTASSNGQVRSRITVVCAECKRLKLKCDRRIPCSSCQKRDCVNRCVYSQAAAEKIDVQSLHNRVLVLEAALAQLKAHPAFGQTLSASVFPPQFLQQSGSGSSYNGLSHNDRALLATRKDGSSLSIPLDDVASTWLSDLDIDMDGLLPSGSRDVLAPNGGLTLTPSQTGESSTLDPSTHWPPLTPYYLDMPPPTGVFTTGDQLRVTPALCQLLPRSPEVRVHLLDGLERTLRVHPCIHWPHLRSRIEALFMWSDAHSHGVPLPSHVTQPSVSFFAVATAGLALGAFAAVTEPGYPPMDSTEAKPAALLALSTHAISVFELGNGYDLDSVVAMIFHVLFMLHDREGVGLKNTVFPMVGKMINVARQMGLHMDPDEHPGVYTLFEAEMRRRVWWEIFYYDVFVSDSMGHVPLIADNSHTTRMPVALEDDRLMPTSTTMPYGSEHSTTVSAYLVQKIKLARLVKYVKKDIFRDPLEPAPELSIDQAAAMEGEIQQWLAELPASFHFDLDPSSLGFAPTSPDMASTLLAQRCELFLVANRLILKLYHAFLRQPRDSLAGPPHQALLGTVNAAHAIVGAAQVLHAQLARTRPAAFLFYSFARGVFDAAVVCAHAVVARPSAIWARTAHEDAEAGLALLRATSAARPGAVEGDVWEGVSVVERMLAKAAKSRGIDCAPAVPRAGTKRKRTNSVGEGQPSTFRLPFVGAEVGIDPSTAAHVAPPPARRQPPIINTSLSSSASQPPSAVPRSTNSSKPAIKHSASDKSDKSDATASGKSKKSSYPSVGYRVREAKRAPSAPEPPQVDYTSIPAPPAMLDLSLRRRSIDLQGASALTFTPASASVPAYANSEYASSEYYLPGDSFPAAYTLPLAKDSPYAAADEQPGVGSSPYAPGPPPYPAEPAFSAHASPVSYAGYYAPYPADAGAYAPRGVDTHGQKGAEFFGGAGDGFPPAAAAPDGATAPGTATWSMHGRGMTPAVDYWAPNPAYGMVQQQPEHQWA